MTAASTASVTFQGVRLRNGYTLHATLDAGVHTFFADAQEPLAQASLEELCALVAGVNAPRRGNLLVQGHRPYDHPPTRRRIASVLASEPRLVGPTVKDHVERVGSLLGVDVTDLDAPLDTWRERRAEHLDGTERRRLAAAIAFAQPAPLVAVLHEPTRIGPPLDEPRVLARIQSWREAGCVVICGTTDPRVAARLSTQAWSLSRIERAEAPRPEYLVRSGGARGLAARLVDHPAVSGLRYDEQLPRDLWVRGSDAEELADAIQAAVLAEGCELHELTQLQRQAHLPSTPGAP